MAATKIATVAYSVPWVNTAGTRCSMRSRTIAPPTAVTVPSRTAGSQPRPSFSVSRAPPDEPRVPRPVLALDGKRARRARQRHRDVGGVGQRGRRPVLEQHVPD